MEKNIIKHNFTISKEDREVLNNHSSFLLWFTGLSGSGKSTIANAVEKELHRQNIHTYTLDGDNVRGGLNKGLTFSPEDRKENIRRIGEVAKLMLDSGLVVLAAFVAPYESDRQMVRSIVGKKNYYEIFVNTSLEECEKRDVKGLYAKARNGEIQDFTGISSPYEIPSNPNLIIDTQMTSVTDAVKIIIKKLRGKIEL